VELEGGVSGEATVPAGASTGKREALELRDGGSRYQGKGVLRAVEAVEREIGPALSGLDPRDQAELDRRLRELDGTPSKGRLGANAMLAVSLAAARAAAAEEGVPLYLHLGRLWGQTFQRFSERTVSPIPPGSGSGSSPGSRPGFSLPLPLLNVLNGGKHARSSLDFQEFLLLPYGFSSFSEALRAGAEVYHTLRRLLEERGESVAVGDEGGFAPRGLSHEEALEILVLAIERAGYRPGEEVGLGLDVAASSLWDPGRGVYVLEREGRELSGAELVGLYRDWAARYPLLSVEDGLGEEDWEGWREMTRVLGERLQLVGDDIFVTRADLLGRGVELGVANALIVKPNQVGTLTETLETLALASASGYAAIVSHRSGDTEDSFIADLAVGAGAGQIKSGAPCRSERLSKYNRLLEIERELGEQASFPGPRALSSAGVSTR
jgi:enolase